MHIRGLVCCILLAGFVVTSEARAGSWRRPVQGGLIGGAVGALVSRSSDIDSRVAVPAFAATGALIGYGRERGWYSRSRSSRHAHLYAWPLYPYAYMSYGYSHGYYGSVPVYDGRSRYTHYRMKAPTRAVARARARVDSTDERQPLPERHPGVATESVEVTLSNGVTIAVRLVKLHDRYIGPRGETYSELPSAEMLRERIEGGS